MADNEYAKPGDTIEIVNTRHSDGKQLLVVEYPEDYKKFDEPGHAWYTNSRGESYFWRPENYKIIAHKTGSSKIVHTTDVEATVKRKRDELLSNIFG